MNVNSAGRNFRNSYGANPTAPGGPDSRNSSWGQAARGTSSASAPGPRAGSRYDREVLRITDFFEELREGLYAMNKNLPDRAGRPDQTIRFGSDCMAYKMLTPEERRIFDSQIAPRSGHLSNVAAVVAKKEADDARKAKQAKEAKEARDAAARSDSTPGGWGPSSSAPGASEPGASGPSASAPATSQAAHAANQKEIASRAAAEAERVAAGRAKFLENLKASIPSPAAVTAASLSSSPFHYQSPIASMFQRASATNQSPPAARFQPPPVAPFQIQRPPQAATQSSSGYAGTSQRSSCFPSACPSVGPYVKIGVGVGAVVGISIGGYLLSKKFTGV